MIQGQLDLGAEDLARRPSEAGRPRCGLCSRPARWNQVQQRWSQYCAGRSCDNRERLCKNCGESFVQNEGDAGTKYCSTACKNVGYKAAYRVNAQCAWCSVWGRQEGLVAGWPYVCRECLGPLRHVLSQLRKHAVTHDRARKLLVDRLCEAGCGRDVLEEVDIRLPGQRRRGALLTVDHDHACCPGDRSCGRCVRGFLCVYCNSAAGMLGDDAVRAQMLADYLQRTRDG